jgi:predicted amino acid dehydrogenase
MSWSIQAAFVGALAVRAGIEPMRAISALTGLAGAIEIGRARTIDVRMKLGILLLGSMVVDGAAYLVHKATGDWVQPLFQIGIVSVMGYVCVKGDS